MMYIVRYHLSLVFLEKCAKNILMELYELFDLHARGEAILDIDLKYSILVQ